ncbi:uncharacterized protein LACBIDRAFT_302829 [Laccaria bicolor S238N-H82]|uniref:Predicted protein n=1 Tax=Laccaria bicolor (strain S238N-H82 / ATCC MYA-4686) TaxID=486041 RepID=B0DIE1_LACBS|nr:uncharacterized protein LACBIDRAFT_302829 [Laccaria bicolor S238N-H82]EDR05675.1 predicted protein [Laccaria bicolor S238N-H82]|eukprot:XP_001883779.1 predicted protein [Laccaria bicolor S238N-H82]
MIKLLDFGWSVSADSTINLPDDEPVKLFPYLGKCANAPHSTQRNPLVEQINLGMRLFNAPEILRGECQDHRAKEYL